LHANLYQIKETALLVGVGNGCNYYCRVASGPSDIGNLPGNNGDELQGLALELRDSAQIDPAQRQIYQIFIF